MLSRETSYQMSGASFATLRGSINDRTNTPGNLGSGQQLSHHVETKLLFLRNNCESVCSHSDIKFTLKAMPLFNVQEYRLIQSATSDGSVDEQDLKRNFPNQKTSYCRIVLPWILSTSLLAVTSIYFASKCYNPANLSKHAFATDLAALHPYIAYEERVFDGALKYDPETGLAYRDFKNSSEAQYFGEPNVEMDAAWDELLRGMYGIRFHYCHFHLVMIEYSGELPVLTDEEATPYTPELRKIPGRNHYYFE